MLEWCTEHWGETPASSDIRGYIAPIFQKFEVHWQKTSALAPAE